MHFFNDVSNEITTFDTPKAAKKGSKDKPKAARKQYKYILRLARKMYSSDSVASGTEVAQGKGSYHTTPEGLENGILSDFSKYLLALHAIHASLDLTCCCLHPTGGSLRHAIHIYL